jgi:hypothetical protein
MNANRGPLALAGAVAGCCLLLALAVVPQRARLGALAVTLAGVGGGSGAAPAASLGDTFGIEPVSIRTTAGGYLLDFRYRVVDAVKAAPLFQPDIKPVLVDAATGKSMAMSHDDKLGALRASSRSEPVNGKEYYVLFSNKGALQKGSKASVAMGHYVISGLVVQ